MQYQSINQFLFKNIQDNNQIEYGKIVDLIIDLNGRVLYLVISLANTLTTAESLQYTAIPWQPLEILKNSADVQINMERDVLNKAPRFTQDELFTKEKTIMDKLDRYYGKSESDPTGPDPGQFQRSTQIAKEDKHQDFEGSEQINGADF